MNRFPTHIFSGYFGRNHCQGIALDEENGYIYYSFTTMLVKSDLEGNIIGTVDGLIGHLGCIAYNKQDGRVYGSLEFKNDSIGRGILASLGMDGKFDDSFYCVIFDVEKIDRVGMSAEKDGIMRAVYLKDVVEDYNGIGENGKPHKYACSGIDGTSFGVIPGDASGKQRIFVCYGVYSDHGRDDNDYQVILCYDAENWWEGCARPLLQSDMHKSGPDAPLEKFFLYTGNTTFGVQNLEYDAYTGDFLAAVYNGSKPSFPNYSMYVIDGSTAPRDSIHRATGEPIRELSLKREGLCEGEIYGNNFPYGATGVYSFGNGYYYFSAAGNNNGEQYTNVYLYRATGDPSDPFERVE
ncbi:MAG: hypothetical protein J6L85_03330 [Clostridia bacterium]|nr:hypothetical protein [Clostridia bacterium]